MKINKAWCLFEQSGTFKTEFQKLGIEAVDCDILDNFNQITKRIEKTGCKDGKSRQECRSLINPVYANRFIREFLLDGETK